MPAVETDEYYQYLRAFSMAIKLGIMTSPSSEFVVATIEVPVSGS
jgi:hypothetical protein